MNDSSGIGTEHKAEVIVEDEIGMIGPVPFFSHCTEIHGSKAPDIPEAMDEEAIRAEESRLFGHPAIGYEC